jgi:hypothetical protein
MNTKTELGGVSSPQTPSASPLHLRLTRGQIIAVGLTIIILLAIVLPTALKQQSISSSKGNGNTAAKQALNRAFAQVASEASTNGGVFPSQSKLISELRQDSPQLHLVSLQTVRSAKSAKLGLGETGVVIKGDRHIVLIHRSADGGFCIFNGPPSSGIISLSCQGRS